MGLPIPVIFFLLPLKVKGVVQPTEEDVLGGEKNIHNCPPIAVKMEHLQKAEHHEEGEHGLNPCPYVTVFTVRVKAELSYFVHVVVLLSIRRES
jgi:hypothetical protein